HPGFEAALGLIEAEPPVLRHVRLEPRGGVSRGLVDGLSHFHRDAAQLGHAPSGFPLGLPADVSVKPEALLSIRNECERLADLAVRDEVARLPKERPPPEPEHY